VTGVPIIEVSKGPFGLAEYTFLGQRYVIGGVLDVTLEGRCDRQGDLLCSDGSETYKHVDVEQEGPFVRM
jgi:hypothetical protein